MKPLNESELTKQLRDGDIPEPPVDLLAKIRSDIPDHLEAQRDRSGWRGYGVLAAALVIGLGGVWLLGVLGGRSGGGPDRRASSATGGSEPSVSIEVTESFGIVQGLVTDEAGSAVRGAVVTIESESSTFAQTVITDESGASRFERIPTGRVYARAELPGYRPLVQEVFVQAGGTETRVTLPILVRRMPSVVPQTLWPETTQRAPELVTKSTRGDRFEPIGAVYDRSFLEKYGSHPFVETRGRVYSSFGLDVGSASYGLSRAMLEDGTKPDRSLVRVEEFINAFEYGDAPPEDEDFRIHVEGASTPFSTTPRTVLMRIGIRARDSEPSRTEPLAESAEVIVEFDHDAVTSYRLLGYETRDEEPKSGTGDAGRRAGDEAASIPVGHRVSALYELKLSLKAWHHFEWGTVRLRHRPVTQGSERAKVIETQTRIRRRQFASSWTDASESLKLAAMAAEFAELLRGSYWAEDAMFETLLDVVLELNEGLPERAELGGLARSVEKAATIDR